MRGGIQVLRKKENVLRITRTFIVIVLISIFAAMPALAAKTSFGIKLGIHTSNAAGVPEGWEDELEWKTGLTAGIFVDFAINKNFSLRPELLYTQKGFGASLLDEIIDLGLKVNLDYFELPLLARYAFSADKKFRPTLFAGPSFAYCSGSILSVSSWIFTGDIDISSITHTTDFGMVLGGGFDYVMDRGVLIVDARFTYGFTKVILSGDFEINGNVETIDEDDFNNYGLSFTLGYAF
jgi:opacity protein-like surface antigen